MCGIIGYIGEEKAESVVLGGLKRMEYRGYDSSGIVVLGQEAKCIKAVGKLENLVEKIGEQDLSGSLAIGHSRWATHGGVTENNAHPHTDCQNNIFVVHNGIIENYKELRDKLIEKKHVFVSETDSEVISHLIEHFFKGNLEEATRKALRLLKGTYGLAVVARKDPDKIVAARMFSPLVLSINSRGGFVASDPSAIVSYSKKMVFLEDGDIAIVKKDDFSVVNLESEIEQRKEIEVDWDVEEAQKGGYSHFMLKEIMEQPTTVANSLRGRLIVKEGTAKLGGLDSVEEELKKTEKINIIACGTSYYAGLIGKHLIEEYAGIPVEVDSASEFRYRSPVIKEKEVFLFLSQSGETADSLAVLKEIKKKGFLTLGIVNVVGSSISRETDAGIYNHAGPEIGVASTKAFTSQLTVLTLLALFLARQRKMSLADGQKFAESVEKLPQLIQGIIQETSAIEKIAEKYKDYSSFLFIGRKYNFPVALEGALKLKEISYVHAEGYPAGEMKHGPIALIDQNFPTLAICLSDSVYDKMISNVQEIKARKGPLVILATEKDKRVEELSQDILYLPEVPEFLSPILTVVYLQLFAYYLAASLGRDIDQPRNLAKSVTVE
jgi:glutamine---fructose-6-phosphate transaminase (isomerizing)